MADDVDMTPYRALLDVRDQAGAFAGATLLPTVRRDAGNLHEAIKKKDTETTRAILKKYRKSAGYPKVTHHVLARIEIVAAAVRALDALHDEGNTTTEFEGLPDDLRQLTPEQTESLLRFYASLPVAELRRRREALRDPLWIAWLRKNEAALANLQVRDALLDAATTRKTATDPRPRSSAGDDAASAALEALLAFAAVAGFVAFIRHRRR